MATMAQMKMQILHIPLFVLLLAMAVAATPPGIANHPSHARCMIKKYKYCYNLEHVCPKFCPDSCTVECVSCKPICSGGSTTPPSLPYSPPKNDGDNNYTPPSPSTPTPPTYSPPTESGNPHPSPTPSPPKDDTPTPPTTYTLPSPPTPTPPTYTPPTQSGNPPPSPTPTPPTLPTYTPPTQSGNLPPSPTPTPPTRPTYTPPTQSGNPSPSPPTTYLPPSPPTPTSPPTYTPQTQTGNRPPSPTPSVPDSPPDGGNNVHNNGNTPSPPTNNPTPPTTYTPPSPPTPTYTPPTQSGNPTPSPIPSYPPPESQNPPPSSEIVKCKNKNYPQCYNLPHVCPSSCPGGCEVDCITCKPVCKCDRPGAVCQDPRFIGGDGITFYFHGKKDQDFCLVSDSNLHINAHFIGRRNENMKRDFTWVQSIVILFGKHQLFLGALKTSTWNDFVDHLSLSFDGEPITLPESEGAKWQSAYSPKVSITRVGATNNVIVEVEGNFKITAKVVPITEEDSRIHNYGITKEDCFAHLDLGFKFYSLSDEVNGVLGQTYRPGYVSRLNIGAKMPVMGGDKDFHASSLFAPDCVVSRLTRSNEYDSLSGSDMLRLSCASGNGRGVVCKR